MNTTEIDEKDAEWKEFIYKSQFFRVVFEIYSKFNCINEI